MPDHTLHTPPLKALKQHLLRLLLCCAPFVLGACAASPAVQSPPPPAAASAAWEESYAALRTSGGTLFSLDPATSQVRIYAFRTGEARRFGHNHVLSAPSFKGYFHLPAQDAASARFDLEFRLDALVFDDPAHRLAVGETFATVIPPGMVESTRANMLGDFNFQADRFPLVRIQSLRIAGEAPKFSARIAVELHGQRRELRLPLTVRGLPQTLSVEGSMVLAQSDFGVKPFSVLGGLLGVEDEVIVEFKLVGRPQ